MPPVGRALFLIANLCAGMLEWETLHLLAAVYAAWLLSEDRTRAGRFLGGAGVALAAAAALMKTFFIVFGLGAFGCVLARHVLRGRGSRASWVEGLVRAGRVPALSRGWTGGWRGRVSPTCPPTCAASSS